MATSLAFPTQVAAQAAVDQIDASKRFPVSDDAVTATWAIPRELADGRWAIPKCRDSDMADVTGYETVEDPAWPESEGLP